MHKSATVVVQTIQCCRHSYQRGSHLKNAPHSGSLLLPVHRSLMRPMQVVSERELLPRAPAQPFRHGASASSDLSEFPATSDKVHYDADATHLR
jgi:hypothetical protein